MIRPQFNFMKKRDVYFSFQLLGRHLVNEATKSMFQAVPDCLFDFLRLFFSPLQIFQSSERAMITSWKVCTNGIHARAAEMSEIALVTLNCSISDTKQ